MEYVDTVTELLGGERTFPRTPESDHEFIVAVRSGLPVRAVANVARSLSMTEDEAFHCLGITKRTAARRKAKNERLRDVESERLLRLARVAAKAEDVLGSRDKAVHWLNRPNLALGGVPPLESLDTDLGFQSVLDVLGRIEYGVPS
ncbi:MAG: antitoxin Xre/MbcA/ParS toxin-binding domain-containing protein [Planctomycetaceae bacterium]